MFQFALEKKANSATSMLRSVISIKSICSYVSFKSCVSLLIFFLDDLSHGLSGVLTPPQLLHYYCWFLLLCLLVFALYIEVFLCWVHIYLQFLYLLPRFIPGLLWSILIFSYNILYLKVYFVLYEYCYSSFLLISIFMEYPFHLLTFSLYVSLRSEVWLL